MWIITHGPYLGTPCTEASWEQLVNGFRRYVAEAIAWRSQPRARNLSNERVCLAIDRSRRVSNADSDSVDPGSGQYYESEALAFGCHSTSWWSESVGVRKSRIKRKIHIVRYEAYVFDWENHVILQFIGWMLRQSLDGWIRRAFLKSPRFCLKY